MPQVIEIITNEMAAWVKMKRNPCTSAEPTDDGAGPAAGARWMTSVPTMAAEKKKLRLSNKKQELAPSDCTSKPATAGLMICDPWTACDMSAFTAIRPAAGAIVRTATDCAGTKKLETV